MPFIQRCDIPGIEENTPAITLITLFAPRTTESDINCPNSLERRGMDKKFCSDASRWQHHMDTVWEEIPLRLRLFFPSRRKDLARKWYPVITQMNKKSCACGSQASFHTNENLLNQSLMGTVGRKWVLGHLGTHLAQGLPGG